MATVSINESNINSNNETKLSFTITNLHDDYDKYTATISDNGSSTTSVIITNITSDDNTSISNEINNINVSSLDDGILTLVVVFSSSINSSRDDI